MNKTWFLFLVIIAGLQPNAQLTVVNQPVINTYAVTDLESQIISQLVK